MERFLPRRRFLLAYFRASSPVRRERRNRRSVRTIHAAATIARTTTAAATAAAAKGYLTARKIRNAVRPSSVRDAIQLVTGSGLVLSAALLDAFRPCADSATPPHRRAAMMRHSGETLEVAAQARSDAAGTRMNVWTTSQTESTTGILSARNSTRYSPAATPMIQGFSRTLSSPGRTSAPARPRNPRTATVA